MHWRIGLIPVLMILAAIGAGCATTSPGPGPAVSPTPVGTPTQPATVPVATPSAPTAGCIEPGPTVTVPPIYTVAVDVTRNPVTLNKQITVTFQGGKGQYLTQEVDVTVTHEDCTVDTASIPQSKIAAGASVTLNGSDRDRVQVTVTINGVSYPIIDRIYTQQTHT